MSATNPNTYGSGLRQGTPEYYKAVDDYLEMYGAQFGAPYNPNEDTLPGWQEAARFSSKTGSDADKEKSYAAAYHQLKRDRRIG